MEKSLVIRHCEDCNYRFSCYTSSTNRKPKPITRINFQISENRQACVNCSGICFGARKTGICDTTGMLTHKYSICDEHKYQFEDYRRNYYLPNKGSRNRYDIVQEVNAAYTRKICGVRIYCPIKGV